MNNRRILTNLWEILENSEPVSAARIASAIVHKNEIISIGFNRRKSHPFQKKYGKNEESIYLHAEIDALLQAKRHLTRSELQSSIIYVARRKFQENTSEEVWGMAKPCEGCMKAIKDHGIDMVFYTMDPRLYKEKYGIIGGCDK